MPFIDLEKIEMSEPLPGYKVRFVHTDSMTCAYWTVTAAAEVPTHSHHHEQIANVIKGEFELTVDGVTSRLTPGVVAVVPPNVPHSGIAITDCQLIDIFHPVREDYRKL